MSEGPLPPVVPGPVALLGSGEFLPGRAELDRRLLAGRPRRVVFLPTAAVPDGPARLRYWVDLGCEYFGRLGVEVEALVVENRTDADRLDLAARLPGAGLVYLSGGNPGFLAATLRGTAVGAAIMAAWVGGAAVAGCSAGAIVLGARADDTAVRTTVRGLGVVGHLVIPHFDRPVSCWPGALERRLAEREPGQSILGIDDETALVGGPHRWGVVGPGRVSVYDEARQWAVYRAGEELELDRRPVLTT